MAMIEGRSRRHRSCLCTTIHKSQGSEYPVEILVIPAGAPVFLTRNLLYTGDARERAAVSAYAPSHIGMMLANNEANERRGMLLHWLCKPVEGNLFVLG